MRYPLALLVCAFLLAAANFAGQSSRTPLDHEQVAAGVPRSPHWPAVRAAFLKTSPECAVCGGKNDLEAHHVLPFHLHRDKELDPANLIALCREHHFTFGHLCSWSSYNPHVREDAAIWRKKIKERP